MNEYNTMDMTGDDLAALMALAGPLYMESRLLEQTTVDNPLVNTHNEDGSWKIRKALEQSENIVRTNARNNMPPPTPTYVPPQQPIHYYSEPVITPVQVPNPVYTTPPIDPQLEFQFDPSKQDTTNDLLKEISKKLNKVISLLEASAKTQYTEPQRLK